MKQDNKLKTFNYCTQAAESFEEFAMRLPEQAGLAPTLEDFLVDYLVSSVKFMLPDNGSLFADHDYKPSMFDLLRLPYPACALEFQASDELYNPASGLAQSKKRISLCFDPRRLSQVQQGRLVELAERDIFASLPQNCLAILAVFEAENVWAAGMGLVVIDLDNDRPINAKEAAGPLSDRIPGHVLAPQLGVRTTKHGLPAQFISFGLRCRLMGLSEDEAFTNLYIDTADEVRAAYEFLGAINCVNVTTSVLAAPRLLNEKRKKKGKHLFFDYQVLNLQASQGGDAGFGLSASPRSHLRRGHIRRLGEKFGNKILWINATMVKPGETPLPQGYIVKALKRLS